MIRLVTQLPVSQLGSQLLCLEPGSKLSLYLLELSNFPVTPVMVETAEQELNRPLTWVLSRLRSTCEGMDLQDFVQRLHEPDPDLLDFAWPAIGSPVGFPGGEDLAAGQYIRSISSSRLPKCGPDDEGSSAGLREETDTSDLPENLMDALHDAVDVYFQLAVKAGLITVAGSSAMLSLMGVRHLRDPQPMLPMVAFALSDCDREDFFLRLILGALTQAFASCDWADPKDPVTIASELLKEMGRQAAPDKIAPCLKVFNDLVFLCGAGTPSGVINPQANTPMVLLQYLVSEALQPE